MLRIRWHYARAKREENAVLIRTGALAENIRLREAARSTMLMTAMKSVTPDPAQIEAYKSNIVQETEHLITASLNGLATLDAIKSLDRTLRDGYGFSHTVDPSGLSRVCGHLLVLETAYRKAKAADLPEYIISKYIERLLTTMGLETRLTGTTPFGMEAESVGKSDQTRLVTEEPSSAVAFINKTKDRDTFPNSYDK